MRFDEERAKWLVIEYCAHYSPKTISSIATMLKRQVRGFYVGTPPEKLGKQIRNLVQPLLSSGLLVKYTENSTNWKRAREMTTKSAQARNEKVPRNVREIYQTNFLHLVPNSSLPVVSLPTPGSDLNFEMCVLMHRFTKPTNYSWELINLLMCASEKKARDDLRIHLYVLPFDYNEVELLESVLDFGEEFKEFQLPLKPSIDEAKGFLGSLAVGKQ